MQSKGTNIMSNSITVNSEPGKYPEIELMPGNTMVVKLAGTSACVIVNVPLVGLPWCEVISKNDGIQEHIVFVTTRLQERIQRVVQKEMTA